ncbi:hypothetical protein ACFOJ6_02455 [Gordonia humi]
MPPCIGTASVAASGSDPLRSTARTTRPASAPVTALIATAAAIGP